VSGTVLALDTSHMKGSVAVAAGGTIAGEVLFDASDTHSATMMPAVDACLGIAGVSISEIDLFAVVTGPGSFTGLRIGLATVKGFASFRKRPVVPLGSLELLAAALPFTAGPVMPLIDARRGEVYAAVYDTSGGSPVVLSPPGAVDPSRAGELPGGVPVIACGTGSIRYREELVRSLPRGSLFAGERWSVPSAGLAAILAAEMEPVPYESLHLIEPVYIRPPDAKLPPETRLGRGGAG